jgi:hypothetical protein
MDELVFIARSENAGDLGYMVFTQDMLAGLLTIDRSTYIFSTGRKTPINISYYRYEAKRRTGNRGNHWQSIPDDGM